MRRWRGDGSTRPVPLPRRALAAALPRPQRPRLPRPHGRDRRGPDVHLRAARRGASTRSDARFAPRGSRPASASQCSPPNRAELLEAHFGVPACGGVLCALNTRLAGPEIAQILEHSRRAARALRPGLRHLVPDGRPRVELGDAYEAVLAGASGAPLDAVAGSTRSARSRSTTRAARRAGRRACCTATAAATSPRSSKVHRDGPRRRQPLPLDAAACSTATAGRTPGR